MLVLIYGCQKGHMIYLHGFLNFLGSDWQPKWIIVKLLEALEIIRHALACSLIDFMGKYDWKKKIVVFVKYEKSNFSVMSSALKFVINCEFFASHKFFARNFLWSYFFLKHVNVAH
jgi:hypothetical protein